MNAKFFISTYRPVPIDEYLVYENAIYPATTSRQLFQTITKLRNAPSTVVTSSMPPLQLVEPSTAKELANPMTNAMVALAVHTAIAGYGALVFCGSRQACQLHAAVISRALPGPTELDPVDLSKRLDLLAELRSLPSGLDPVLEKTLINGVGFHRMPSSLLPFSKILVNPEDAGMTTEERDLIAQAYDQGALRVLIATCSLAAGVNLPARRVIINGARMGRDLVGPAMLYVPLCFALVKKNAN